MCPTLAYAIIDFWSLWNKQIKKAKINPVIEKKKINFLKIFLTSKKNHIRNKPKPPSFRRTPAKIIEPMTGDSTWALGNHKWKK
jgi:hypothetical protein